MGGTWSPLAYVTQYPILPITLAPASHSTNAPPDHLLSRMQVHKHLREEEKNRVNIYSEVVTGLTDLPRHVRSIYLHRHPSIYNPN